MSFTARHALVTGASAGIGEAIAKQLAAQKCDLILVARRADRLEALAAELRAAEGITVEVLAADLTNVDDLAKVEVRLADQSRPVDLLVNNAGFGTLGNFAELPIDVEDREIRLNVIAVVHLTRAALPGMIARKRGWIMNVSSVAGFQAGPTMATYCSTKAFVTSFTESISEELKGTGVSATAVCPGVTSTEFQQVAGQGASIDKLPKAAIMTADEVAAAALKATEKGTVIAVTGLPNRMLVGLTSMLPRVVTRKVAGLTMRQLD